ncbi:MAG: hypothetical protein WC878_02990 [Candidatus Paceibacterota bacterium]|jgi:hypothetical protein
MFFVPFYVKFEKVADAETRIMRVIDASSLIPAGRYAFVENFCNDDSCDCRKAMINVIDVDNAKSPSDFLATIGFGWEDADFYSEWLGGDIETGRVMAGSYLESGGRQTNLSGYFLEFWKMVIAQDAAYAARIKKHYDMFKGD